MKTDLQTACAPWHEDQVSYLTDDPASTYADELRAAKSKGALLETLTRWRRLAPDAYAQALDQTEPDLLWALKHARHEKHAERVNTIAGPILMPAVMLYLSVLGAQYAAPWGACFIRARDAGTIRQDGDGCWFVDGVDDDRTADELAAISA
jgi:hypothetical protein